MATISITIAAGDTARVIDALAAEGGGYSATIPDPANRGSTIPNPQTKAQFARQVVVDKIHQIVRSQERAAALTAAAATAAPDVT